MKIKKLSALLVSAVLCAGMAAPAFAFEGEATPVEQPILPEVVEDVVTITDETSGALTPEGNLTLVDDYHTNYSDGSGQQFITLVSKSGNTFYLVIDRNAKGQQTVHFMNLVDESDLLALMEDEDADAYTAEKEAAAQAELERKQAEEDAKKAEEEAAASGTEQPKENKITKYSTALDGTRKFRDFFFSGLAVQRLSDLICLEHQLSVIEKKPYRERQKRITYPPRESNRDRLCGVIDEILQQKPTDYEDFLQNLEQQGYEIKRGKYTSVKGKGQKRFIRFRTLGEGYSEEEIKAVLAGKAEHHPRQKQSPKEQPFQLLVDIQAKLAEGKGGGYERWAKKHNLKEMSKTLLFLQEQKISSADELKELADAALSHYHELGDSIKAAEQRMTEIAVLRAHIVNYAKTRPVYDAYRKSGYSSKFLEAHREEITLHKTAKAAFNESGLKKLPKVKDLNAEYSALLTMKKALYPEYRKARDEMQEIVKAQKNVELFFAEEKDSKQGEQIR